MLGVIDFLSLSEPHTKEKTQNKQKNIMKPKPDMAVLYVYPVHCILYLIFGPNTIPHICHGSHGYARVNFFWPV